MQGMYLYKTQRAQADRRRRLLRVLQGLGAVRRQAIYAEKLGIRDGVEDRIFSLIELGRYVESMHQPVWNERLKKEEDYLASQEKRFKK